MAQIEVSNLVTGADNVDDYFTTANPPLENHKVTLSAAQLNALGSTAVEIVPTTSGHVLIPVLVHLIMRNGSAPYSSGGDLDILWNGTSTVAVDCGTFASNVGSTANTVVSTIIRPQEGRSSFSTGAALEIKAAATVTGAGNGTMDVSTYYYEFEDEDF